MTKGSPSAAVAGTPPGGTDERRSIFRRLLDFVFGYDFFISYAWADGGHYAQQLAARLERSGFDVFLDREDYASGDDWQRVGSWTLRRTGQLILVGSPLVLASDPVARELAEFAKTGRRIVPIDFGGSLAAFDDAHPVARHLPPQLLRILELPAALASGPSDETLQTIRRTFKLVRQDRKRVRALTVVAAILAALAVAALAFAIQARAANERTQAALASEQHERERAVANEVAAEKAAKAALVARDQAREARDLERAARDAEKRQRRIAEERQRYAEQQRALAQARQREAEIQRRAAEMRQLQAMAGQRFTEASSHFARAETADSESEAELLRRDDLSAQIAALESGKAAAADGPTQLRLRNLRSESDEARARLALLAERASDERRSGRGKLTEGHDLWRRVQSMNGAPAGPPPFAPTEPGLFAVEILSVGNGQSLILHYGQPDAPHFVLIDGGAANAYERALGPRLQSLKERFSPAAPLPLELVAITNQDDDRLHGFLRMFEDMARGKGAGSPPQFLINRLWHNTFGPTDPSVPWQKMRVRALIEQLSLPLNVPFDHLAMRPPSGRLSIDLADGLRATLLGPDDVALRKLYDLWRRQLDRPGQSFVAGPGEAPPPPVPSSRLIFPDERFSRLEIAPPAGPRRLSDDDVKGAASRDGSIPNLASLVILFEYGGRRFLQTGDARGDQILAALDSAGLLDEAGRFFVDVMLVPHLGSDTSVSLPFFSKVRADRYLFTGTGTFGNPDTRTLEMLLEARGRDCIELDFINREGNEELGPRIDAFFAGLPQGAHCVRRIFRSGNRGALTVDLLGRIRY